MRWIIHVLLLLSFVVVQSSLATSIETIEAKIADTTFQSGEWYSGTAMGGSCAKIVNTGDTPHTFWVQLSATDPYGKSWWGDAQSVYLQPGETSDWVCSIWDIPNNVPLGSYTASLNVGEEYDYNSAMIYNVDDSQDKPNAFYISR
jgi:hypothetical protein